MTSRKHIRCQQVLPVSALTRAERAFFASEGTAAAHVSGCSSDGFNALSEPLDRVVESRTPFLSGPRKRAKQFSFTTPISLPPVWLRYRRTSLHEFNNVLRARLAIDR